MSRHCVELFLDFVAIFRKLMVILAMNEKVPPPTVSIVSEFAWTIIITLFCFCSQDKKKEKK